MPTFRQYNQTESLEDTDAFVIDRLGVGTLYIEAQNFTGGGGSAGVMIYATLPGGDTDAWDPTGYVADVDAIVITTDAGGSTLQGLSNGTADRRVALFNDGPGDLTIANGASGTDGDGFGLPFSVDLLIPAAAGVMFAYDATNGGWRALVAPQPFLDAGTYGNSTFTPVVTVNSEGQVSDITSVEISGGGGGSGIAFEIDGTYATGSAPFTVTGGSPGDPASQAAVIDTNSACSVQTTSLGSAFVFTVPEDGNYLFTCNCTFILVTPPATDTTYGGQVYINRDHSGSGFAHGLGTAAVTGTSSTAHFDGTNITASATAIVACNAGDKIFFVWSNQPPTSGSTYLTINETQFSGFKIG